MNTYSLLFFILIIIPVHGGPDENTFELFNQQLQKRLHMNTKCNQVPILYQRNPNGVIRLTERLIRASSKWPQFYHQLAFIPFILKMDSKCKEHASNANYTETVHLEAKKILNEYITLYPYRKTTVTSIKLKNWGTVKDLLKC
uniref:Uncharacterized protein n=1 Tax=Rhabditophanes sp. KR3021 TaxID=114890 RepID=A0AC35U344_9BILA